jgi:hypothetical protein
MPCVRNERNHQTQLTSGHRKSRWTNRKPWVQNLFTHCHCFLLSLILPCLRPSLRPFGGHIETAYSFLFGEQSRNRPCHAVICNARHVPSGRKFIESVQAHLSHTHPFGCPFTAQEEMAAVAFGQPPRSLYRVNRIVSALTKEEGGINKKRLLRSSKGVISLIYKG